MKEKYLFTSERLGFRKWNSEDLETLANLTADESVMEFFPKTLNREESENLLNRLIHMYEKKGYTYFATELLDTGEFIGFLGLAYQDYASEFTPATDIGWRLKKSAWGKGYATEGAIQCLEYAFHDLGLEKVIATCPTINLKSENVMQKIGMKKKHEFLHPELSAFPHIEKCVCYEIVKNNL